MKERPATSDLIQGLVVLACMAMCVVMFIVALWKGFLF